MLGIFVVCYVLDLLVVGQAWPLLRLQPHLGTETASRKYLAVSVAKTARATAEARLRAQFTAMALHSN